MVATGKSFTLRGVNIAKLRDGEIASNRVYTDMASFRGEIGMWPPPTRAR
jgi:hypothetical protein